MEILLEIILQFLFELFGGLIVEGIAELFSRLFRAIFSGESAPSWFHLPTAIGCQLAGVLFGFLSLFVSSAHIIKTPQMRFVNLLITPVLMALAMVAWGRWMAKRDREKTPLNRFVCAYGFALCYLLTRFAFAR